MHQKKRKLFVLYSIPIWFRKRFNSFSKSNLCNKEKLYLVSYSVPLSLLVVLLLGFSMMINPSSALKTSAVEIGEEGSNNMTRTAPAPTIAINITNDTSDGHGSTVAGQVETAPGAGTAYRSHKVNITGSNIMNYDLKISGPTELTPSEGATTTVGGAGGKTGAEMSASDANVWGYAWGEDNEAVEEMTYNTISTSGTGLTCDDPSTSYDVNCERKLVFGANFNTEANPGTYTAKVNLALTATPAVVTYTLSYDANSGSNPPAAQTLDSIAASETFTIKDKENMTRAGYNFLGWSDDSSATVANASFAPGQTVTLQKDSPTRTLYAVWETIATLDTITTMQEMTSAICRDAAVGATKTLTDSRDNNSYVIYKASDSQCWMGENLRLNGGALLKPTNSDVSSDWTLPVSSGSWSEADSVAQMRNGYPDMIVANFYSGDGKGWRSGFGNYYSWAAATAGTGTAAVTSTNAPSSICPLGWKLPTYSGDYSFSNLISVKSAWQSGLTINGTANMNGYYLGSTEINLVRGANFWPVAGDVASDGLRNPGKDGCYWFRSTGSTSSSAYYLSLGPIRLSSDGVRARSAGCPVRCVAAQ